MPAWLLWVLVAVGLTIGEIFQLTKIDRWFLTQIKEIVDFEEELAAAEG